MIIDWRTILNFERDEFHEPRLMDRKLIEELDILREFIGKPIIITSSNDPKDEHCPNSYHYAGKAVDIICPNMSNADLLIASLRFRFGGYGLYSTHIHLDTRPIKSYSGKAMWCKTSGIMLPITANNLKAFF